MYIRLPAAQREEELDFMDVLTNVLEPGVTTTNAWSPSLLLFPWLHSSRLFIYYNKRFYKNIAHYTTSQLTSES
jgi:hypothetical protein